MSDTDSAKHTPGPWEYRRDGDRHYVAYGICEIIEAAWGTIEAKDEASLQTNRAEREANAKLIAAAPDMLSALQAADEELRLIRMKDTNACYNPLVRAQIRAAISKAEVKPSPGLPPEHEKLQKIRPTTEAIGGFLEWLGDKGVALCVAHEHTEHCENTDSNWPKYICGLSRDEYAPTLKRIETWLAEFTGIDSKKLSAEKDAMLQELRNTGAKP